MASAQHLSEYARKYKALPGSHRSGYTPTKPVFPERWSDVEGSVWLHATAFQRAHLYGFTTRELVDLDAISSRDLPPSTLANHIIPLLSNDRWETAPPAPSFNRTYLYSLSNGNGQWTMDNIEVRRIMTPILKLASRILTSSHVLQWLDALMNSPRIPIPPYRIPLHHMHETYNESFHLRPNASQIDYEAAITRREQLFESLISKWNLTYGFSSAKGDPRGPGYDDDDWTDSYGATIVNWEEKKRDPSARYRVWVYLQYQQIESLFRDDLTSSERMGVEWETANTLVHETMHAVANVVQIVGEAPNSREPYFQNDAIPEIGFAFEIVANGGTTSCFLYPGLPLGYWLKTKWPTLCERSITERTQLVSPGLGTEQERFPIPVSLFSDIQQETFWTVGVRTFGHGLIHYRTIQEGVAVSYYLNSSESNQSNSGSGNALPTVYRTDARRIASGAYSSDRVAEIVARTEQLRQQESMTEWAALSPEAREIVKFSRKLAITSQVEKQFWSTTQAQQLSVTKTLDCWDILENQPYQRDQTLAMMVNCLVEAREKHEIIIATLHSLQAISGVTYTDRIKELLSWNRGTRTFLRELCRTIQPPSPPEIRYALNELNIQLELCRMKLWDPTSCLDGCVDHNEVAMLQNAYNVLRSSGNNSAACKDICKRLLAANDCPVTIQNCAYILLGLLDARQPRDWQANYERVEGCIVTLRALRWGSTGWTAFLNTWEALGQEALAEMRRAHGDEGPQNTLS